MKNRNRVIMGSAIGLVAVLTAIDHTRHQLPEAKQAEQANIIIESEEDSSSPCSMGNDDLSSPCSMGNDDNTEIVVESDSADSSPCGLGE